MAKRLMTVCAVIVLSLAATSARAAEPASVFVIHGIPDVTVDVYLNGTILRSSFMFGESIGPAELPADTYTVEIRVGMMTVLAADLALEEGVNYTAIAHLDELGGPKLSAFVNDVRPIERGLTRLTVRHTAAAPTVDVRLARGADGAAIATIAGLSNSAQIGPIDIRPGGYSAGLLVGDTEVFNSGLVNLAPRTSTIVYAIGSFPETFRLFVQTIALDAEMDVRAAESATEAPGRRQFRPILNR